MIRNYLKIAWRNITRHKAHSIINISGLTIGIAACLLIFIIVQYEQSFDKDQPNYKNIYHLVTEEIHGSETTYNPGVPDPAAESFRLDFPQVKMAAMESSYGSQITVPNGTSDADNKKFTENTGIFFVEPQYFDIFYITWLSGKPSVLAEPNMVVISRKTAEKYFGDWKNATGKIVKMDNLLELKVAGVIEDAPSNSDFPLKVIVSYITFKQHPIDYNYQDNWHSVNSSHQVFMLLPAGANLQNMNAQIKYYYNKRKDDKRPGKTFEYLQPLSEMHFDTKFGATFGDHLTSRATLNTLSFIGLLIIIMASINFINLSTAQSVGRSKEVGIRKVLGSNRSQLIAQVMGETTLIVLIAVVLAVFIAKLALPYLKNVSTVGDDISLINTGSVLFMGITTVVVILASGLYPALVVSGFKPVLAIKNKITAASIGGIPLRRALVVTQFAISQLLIIGTLIAVKQMSFVNSADLGFNKDAVLLIPGSNDSVSLSRLRSFKEQLLENPSVTSVSFASDAPSSDNNMGTNFYFDHSTVENNITTFLKFADADYFKTFQLRFVAGKGYDAADTTRQVVVNETFLKKVGIQNPDAAIGKTVRIGGNNGPWSPIVGVVQDFKTNSLRELVKPIVILQSKKYESQIAVKIQTRDLRSATSSVEALWERTFPEYAYNGSFFDESIAQFYNQENQLALAYKIFAAIAIFISCLGLYGLVAFMVVQRTKEVGVRKVLGASVGSIVLLFSKEFIILIVVSFAIATPAALYMMNSWLQTFAYRVNITAWVFVMAIAASVIIACLTVGYKAVRAALVNPVKSLRSE